MSSSSPPDSPDSPGRTVFSPTPGAAPAGEQGPKKTVMMHAPPNPGGAEVPGSSSSRTAFIPPEDLAALRAQMAQQPPGGAPAQPVGGPQAHPGAASHDPAARGRTEFVSPEMAQALRQQVTNEYGQQPQPPAPAPDPAARGRTEFVSPEMAAALRAQMAQPQPGGPYGSGPVPPATLPPGGAYPGAYPPGPAYPHPGAYPGPGGPGPMGPGPVGPGPGAAPGQFAPGGGYAADAGFTAPRPAPTEYAVLRARPSSGDPADVPPPETTYAGTTEDDGRSGPRWILIALGGLLALLGGGFAAWMLIFNLNDEDKTVVADPAPPPPKPEPKPVQKPQPIIQPEPPPPEPKPVIEPEPEPPPPEPEPEPEPEPKVTKPVKPSTTPKARDTKTEVYVRRIKEIPLELRIDGTIHRVDGDRLLPVKTGVREFSVRPAGTQVWYSHRLNIESQHKYQLLLGDTYFELRPR